MSIDNDIAILEQVPMLRALGRAALRLIALGAETREVRPGEVLFRPGDRIDCAYVVQAGVFRLSADPDLAGNGIEAGPGTLLGEFALLAEGAQPLTAVAQDQARVIRVSRSMFLKILEDDPSVAMRLRDYVAQRARQSIAELLEVRYALDPNDQ
ncbi:MAG: Crp/Fnr family transcriptional regulator [Pseudorhodoplanes sp.]|uniref:Crp/Fnr family transcriptional regulator n=1 Tax=Pseudorhodoplanes sp. TaxID=1934341 RepID=UPI003D1365FB